jgi:hypothetical protein
MYRTVLISPLVIPMIGCSGGKDTRFEIHVRQGKRRL